jgi:hypothetical protein
MCVTEGNTVRQEDMNKTRRDHAPFKYVRRRTLFKQASTPWESGWLAKTGSTKTRYGYDCTVLLII